jgi:hypothetical protein
MCPHEVSECSFHSRTCKIKVTGFFASKSVVNIHTEYSIRLPVMASSNNEDDPASVRVTDNGAVEGTTDAAATTPTVQVQGLPLDWTQLGNAEGERAMPIRYPSDVAEILPEETDVCIVGTAGQKITVIGKDFSRTVNPQMESLILRSHLIQRLEGLHCFTNLQLLELYDNQVDALTGLDEGPNGCPGSTLRVLDMSYNSIREMQPVALCPNLQELCKYCLGIGYFGKD